MFTTASPKLASTASGLSFEQWSRRPVYLAQCKTFEVAKSLRGIQLEPGKGLALNRDRPDDGLTTFRCLPAYRTPAASALRNEVAKLVRAQRKNRSGN